VRAAVRGLVKKHIGAKSKAGSREDGGRVSAAQQTRLRVFVPNARLVYGVPDLVTQELQEGQCFLQVMIGGQPRPLLVS
jgi:hypothetical protein